MRPYCTFTMQRTGAGEQYVRSGYFADHVFPNIRLTLYIQIIYKYSIYKYSTFPHSILLTVRLLHSGCRLKVKKNHFKQIIYAQ